MDCNEFVTLVTEYLEEAQAATERLRMDGHRAECDGCEAYLDQMIRTVDMLRRLAGPSSEPTDRPGRTSI
jgi:predicted anti-sigma-YlaC factor YlaD